MIGTVPDKPRLSFPHPVVDSQGGGVLRTESRASLVHVSAGRADLVVTARRRDQRVVLVTDALSRLTEPLVSLLRETGATWVVREAGGGFSDGMTGRVLGRFDESPDEDAGTPPTVSERYLRPTPRPWVRARVVVARRHRASAEARLGGDLEALASALAGSPPSGWGLHEPAGLSWNRDDLTTFARRAMPHATRAIAVGSPDRPLSGSIVTHRTKKGIEEITEVLIALGADGSPATADAVATLPETLATLAEGMPLIAVAFVDTGARDLSRAPVLPSLVTPAALLLGAPGVRQLDLRPDEMAARFGATAVGRARLPALVFPFSRLREAERWSALQAILSSVGHERLSAALGRDTTRLLRLDEGERVMHP